MSDRISSGPAWEALKEQWLRENQPGILENRGSMMQVICPDGEPIFIPMFGESLYASTSVATPAVKTKGPMVAAAPKAPKAPGAKVVEPTPVVVPAEVIAESESESELEPEAEEFENEAPDIQVPEE